MTVLSTFYCTWLCWCVFFALSVCFTFWNKIPIMEDVFSTM